MVRLPKHLRGRILFSSLSRVTFFIPMALNTTYIPMDTKLLSPVQTFPLLRPHISDRPLNTMRDVHLTLNRK